MSEYIKKWQPRRWVEKEELQEIASKLNLLLADEMCGNFSIRRKDGLRLSRNMTNYECEMWLDGALKMNILKETI